jgi:hypothetical protein
LLKEFSPGEDLLLHLEPEDSQDLLDIITEEESEDQEL